MYFGKNFIQSDVLSLRQIGKAMRTSIDNLEQQESVVFSYPKADLMKVVEARTSVIGKMRGDKEHPDFINRMSLTQGESFLSGDMLLDAIVHVREWLMAFMKSENEMFGIDNDGKVFFIVKPKSWWARNEYSSVEMNIKEALIEFIIYKWFEYVNMEESQLHFAKYEEYAHRAQIGMNTENGTLERRYNTPFNTIFRGK